MTNSSLVNATRQYNSETLNGAVTHSTSLSKCVDFFFLAGASRRMSESDIIFLFMNAYTESKHLAYQILFWARDCRGGAGEKRLFRVISKFCLQNMPDEWDILSVHVPTFGSFKDLFIIETPNYNVLNYFAIQLEENSNANLLAKYFPRKGKWFTEMHKYLKMSPKEFRKYLVSKSNTVEQLICGNKVSDIDYSKVPSIAMNNYRNLFTRKDNERFLSYIGDVLDGKTKVNAATLYPHQLYQAIQQGDNVDAVEAQWKALPNYMKDSTERILPVCDVSGSMSGLPMNVSVSLGLYIAERNEGIFKNAFITFSSNPEMLYVQGDTLADKLITINRASWGYSTDLIATFELILNSAVRGSISQDEMPTKLLIISDMEFDAACDNSTNLDAIKALYQSHGYKLPEIIFWNVNGRLGNVPANIYDSGIGLVSGFSPAILKAILKGEVVSPEQLMLTAVDIEKYKQVVHFIP
jgi:hypothetical protein